MATFRAELESAAATFGISLAAEQLEAFDAYNAMLLEWNGRVNLTALTAPRDVAVRHMLDSLSAYDPAVFVSQNETGVTVIDVGTGAGFPGLPLKIAHNGLRLTLLDSLGKRAEFLRAAVRRLGLKGVAIVNGRAEDIAREPGHRERYDVAVARSVAPLNTLLEYTLPFVKVGGAVVALKGAAAAEEVSAASRTLGILGGDIKNVSVSAIRLPGEKESRAVVRVTKSAPTPGKYPRRAGMPRKRPLVN